MWFMSTDRITRRQLVLGATAATAALTGCLGGGGGTESDDDPAAATTTEPPTATPADTTPTTTSDPTATPGESTAFCAPWEGQTTPYDAAGTPFFFGYDYVGTWTPEGITDYSSGHFVRFSSPPVGEDEFSLTLRVSQFDTAFTPAERDEEIEYFLNFEAEPREVVDEITYDGESLPVLGLAEQEVSYYQPGLSVFLPYGSGNERRYYSVGVVLFDGLRVPDEERQACIAVAEAAQSAVIESLTPNPDTTFEGATS